MQKLKRVIEKVPLVNEMVRWVYHRLFPDPTLVTYWIDKYVSNADCNVVQIGSNDGVTGDPIFRLIMKKTKWNVLLVEPVPYLFEKLKNNYPASPRFHFENAAINDGSKQPFYFVAKEAGEKLENLPAWYDQLGSFNKEHMVKHLNGILEPYIQQTAITGMTLDQLFTKNNVRNLKLLHIDTEGYDWKVLSQLDLKKHAPSIILFEHKHLKDVEVREAKAFLDRNYQILEFGGDLLCIRKEVMKRSDSNKLRDRKRKFAN
jgi:FkbM family methyltransferase